jgi:hypothetical protein
MKELFLGIVEYRKNVADQNYKISLLSLPWGKALIPL